MSGLAKCPSEGFTRKWRVTFISKSSRRSTLKAFKCSLTTELVNGRPVGRSTDGEFPPAAG